MSQHGVQTMPYHTMYQLSQLGLCAIGKLLHMHLHCGLPRYMTSDTARYLKAIQMPEGTLKTKQPDHSICAFPELFGPNTLYCCHYLDQTHAHEQLIACESGK